MPRAYVKKPKRDPRPAVTRGIPVQLVDALLEQGQLDNEDAITRDSTLGEDLGLDSLDVVELAMVLEEAYHLGEVHPNDLDRWRTV